MCKVLNCGLILWEIVNKCDSMSLDFASKISVVDRFLKPSQCAIRYLEIDRDRTVYLIW